MPNMTINGHQFEVPAPFQAGMVLDEGMARSLNQTLRENVANNFRKKVADASDPLSLQPEITAYVSEYKFGERKGGGGQPRDPVRTEAIRLATGAIRAKLKETGQKRDPAAIRAAAEKLVDQNPAFLQTAQERVKEAQDIASQEIDLSGLSPASVPDGPAEPAQAAA